MKYAIIQDNKVVNVAISDSALESNWIQSDTAAIGDTYENGQFSKPSVDVEGQKSYVRALRNARLLETDWTQLADSQVDKAVWATYRQALRDMTTQDGFPLDVEFPTLPT